VLLSQHKHHSVFLFVLWWLICFVVSFNPPEDGSKQSHKPRVVLRVVTTQTVAANVSDKT
jgi:hypothetical protein